MDIKSMTGLEIMQALLHGKLPPPSMGHTIGVRPILVEHGEVVFEATADDRHLNPMGVVHGGFAASVMDTVTGCAAHTTLGPGLGYGTIDLAVKLLRPVPRDVTLLAHAHVISSTRRLVVSNGVLKDDNDKIYATSTATNMIIHPQ